MPSPELVAAVKVIVSSARSGDLPSAYAGYEALFASPVLGASEPNERRQVLRLMIHAKGVPDPPTAPMVAAHRAALPLLVDLVAQHSEPADQEMLGMCYVALGDEKKASEIFRAALTTERERNAQSDLCGALMKRVSML